MTPFIRGEPSDAVLSCESRRQHTFGLQSSLKKSICAIFTALHGMQARFSDENSAHLSVRLSVRLSVCPSVCQTRAL